MDENVSELKFLEDFLAMAAPDDIEAFTPLQSTSVATNNVTPVDPLGETLATLEDVERSYNLTDLDTSYSNQQNDHDISAVAAYTNSNFNGFQTDYMNEFENVSEPSVSPAPSTGSNSAASFSFPRLAPTPEAALPLADCLTQCPAMDTSLFFKHEVVGEKVKKEEASSSMTAKALAAHIKKRRRASGLEELPSNSEEEPQAGNELTRADIVRRERRRASNRRAATKCRIKKKALEEQSKVELTDLQKENATLKAEVAKLRTSRKALEERFQKHLAICRYADR